MKKLFIGLGAIVVLVIAAAVIAPMVIPLETAKKELLSQIRTATGREARIDGDLSLSLLPRVQIVAGKVSLANAPGGAAPSLVSLERLEVRVALWPLLGGGIEVDSFVLNKPVISLEIDRNGKPNWDFTATQPAGQGAATAPAPSGTPPAAQSVPSKSGDTGDGGAGLSGLSLGDVRLVDGRISYSDARTGETQTIEAINATVSLPSLSEPLNADGSLVWNGEKIDLALAIAEPGAFLAQRQSALKTTISSAPVSLTFDGTVATGPVLIATGPVTLDVPSIRKLAAWAGSPLDAPGTGFGPLKIAGAVDVKGQRYAFRNAKISFDQINGAGEVSFDGGGRVPNVVGRLDLDMLDVTPYLPPEENATASSTPSGAAPPASGDTAASPAPPGQASPGPAKQGWSDAPLDLAGLKAANARFELTAGGIRIRKIKIGASVLTLSLKDAVFVADLVKMALYDGNGAGRVSVNGAGSVPTIAADFDLAGVQANPMLKDAADFDKLEGAANADFSITSRGGSERAIVSALAGKGKIAFLDGAIRGVNLASMARNVSSAFLDPAARQTQKTDFAELGGSFTITRGILTNNDLLLKSPLLRLTGKGTVSLPPRTLNYRLEPQVVATTEGQGGKTDAAGIKVPVIVSGGWDNLSYKPDLAGVIDGIVKDPEKALEGLKNLIPGQSGGGSDGGAKTNPADALKKLFGR